MPMTDEPLLVSTTFERQEHAEDVARALLNKRIIACAQVHGPVKSMYWWKNEIQESVEFLLTLKTLDSLYPEVESTILEEHPYDLPEIIAEPLVRISSDYLNWMKGEMER
ncbi:divalent-cation tolerance protein CutA [Desulfosediminicola flagellatus]|uniref:divalent-cation tolerance protein CutA n=1 Tax=Desulfosediminicola flagellatus TaxID=2569541 RepID=UPI0010AB9DF7|nr:divalent-cation tolerance protein CutA [Desulfosediminicola flagellatus]